MGKRQKWRKETDFISSSSLMVCGTRSSWGYEGQTCPGQEEAVPRQQDRSVSKQCPHQEVPVESGDPPVLLGALPASQELLSRGEPPGAGGEGCSGGVGEHIELVQSY